MPALLLLEPTPLASLLPLQLLLAFVLCQIPVRDGVIVTVGTTQECGLHLSPGDLILVCALCGLLLSDMFRMLLHRKGTLLLDTSALVPFTFCVGRLLISGLLEIPWHCALQVSDARFLDCQTPALLHRHSLQRRQYTVFELRTFLLQ